jgi:hypothetical protein
MAGSRPERIALPAGTERQVSVTADIGPKNLNDSCQS